eukprot:Platyproteum_vivax@DN12117_c0_g1_i1.p1
MGYAPQPPPKQTFFDHVIHFGYFDKKIFFRHYQISSRTADDLNSPDNQILTEIGPRFALNLMRIFEGAFGGPTMYKNPIYMTPTATRVEMKHKMSREGVDMRRANTALRDEMYGEDFLDITDQEPIYGR